MKARIISGLLIVLMMLSLTGCGKDYLPDISDKELARCEQYAVKLLLKYNKGSSSNLLSEEEVALAQNKIEQKAELQARIKANKEAAAAKKEQEGSDKKDNNTGDGQSSDTATPVYSDIDEFLGLQGIDIEYSGINVVDSYPQELGENDFQGIVHAGNGNKLVVINFNITNNSGADYTLDIPSFGIKSAFKVNGSKTKVPLTTMLFDDLYNFKETIIAGETKTAVLLMEINDMDAENISSLTFTIKVNGNKMETTLL